jgi:23S rRNA pseudouridine2605 synthase
LTEHGGPDAPGERVQKVLAHLGLASRREAEEWIRAGRVTLNGRVAQLGDRYGDGDQLQLDGRPIRQRVARNEPVLLCHRSPGQRLLPGGEADDSFAAHVPRRAGRRFISVAPLPQVDGGLELLTADGALAERLQRAVRELPMEFSVRVRGELSEEQHVALLAGQLDSGATLPISAIEAAGGEGSNRWYTLHARGVRGNDLRQLLERCGVTASRVLRTRLGTLALERSLARGRSRSLTDAELEGLIAPGAEAADRPSTATDAAPVRRKPARERVSRAAPGRPATDRARRGPPDRAARGRRSPPSRGPRSR